MPPACPPDDLEATLARAEKERWSPLEILAHLLGPQADLRRQRAIERRIREARFREPVSLEGFDWAFNAQTIDRIQIEALATGEFIRRGDNLVIAGQSGVGKSRIVQSVGRAACAQGYSLALRASASAVVAPARWPVEGEFLAARLDREAEADRHHLGHFRPVPPYGLASRPVSRTALNARRWSGQGQLRYNLMGHR